MAQIYKKQGSWAFRVYYKDDQGKRKSINRQGFKLKSDAQDAARELEMKKSQVGLTDSETITFANYFNNWVETYKIGRWQKNTEGKYIAASKFIRSYFTNTLLKDISKQQYQKMIDEYAKKHVKETVSLLNSYIRTSIRDALEEQIIYKDFTRNVEITGKSRETKIKYLEQKDAEKLRSYCMETANLFYVTKFEIALAITTGMRYGEVVGLTWNDIDFNNHTLKINKQYDYQTRSGFKKTKTESSNRIIDIDTKTLDMLKKLKLMQSKFFLNQGYINKHNLVFLNNRHEIPTDNAANKALKSILKNNLKIANLITFHGLRHTHASILIANGISIEYIAQRLGHADTSITSKVYIHLLQDRKYIEAKKTTSLFG